HPQVSPIVTQAQDIPLVPVPPPPLAKPEEPGSKPVSPSPTGRTVSRGGQDTSEKSPSAGVSAVPASMSKSVTPPTVDPLNPPPPVDTSAQTGKVPMATPVNAGARSNFLPAVTDTSGPAIVPTPAQETVMPVPVAGATPRQLLEAAKERYKKMDSYIARLIRREMVKGEMNPEEIILLKFRKNPWSVYLKWLGKEGQGREAIFVQGKYENKIHTLLAAGDIPFMPGGKRISLSPDSIMVKSATRHPITEAGIGASLEKLEKLIAASERGDYRLGKLISLGPTGRNEFDQPALALEHNLPPGIDPSLPKGGKRVYFFDPANGLPMLVIGRDERGQEVEYYRYDRLQPAVRLDDSDFDPEKVWSPGKDKETARASK
ncbi:MAG: DUF1571 domain-containing protein, partial [Gemmataceae bacterium]